MQISKKALFFEILNGDFILCLLGKKKMLPNCNSMYKANIITCIGISQSDSFDIHT